MASIPLVALDVKNQQPSPLDLYGKMQGILGQQQEQQVRGLQIQQAQLSLADQQAATKAMQSWDGKDYNDLPTLIRKNGGSLNAVLDATQKIVARQQQNATLDETTLKNQQTRADQYRGRIQAIIDADPDQQDSLWAAEIAKERQAGTTVPQGMTDKYPGDDAATYIANHFALGSVLAKEATEKMSATGALMRGQAASAEAPGIIAKNAAETANMPTPAQAAAQRAASLGKTQVETAKSQEELNQLRQNAANVGQPDATGFKSPLPVAEYNKRYDAFSKSKGFGQLQTLQGSYSQFQNVLSDLDAGKPLTGAASVVALFNAIGISAEPLAGKGFRINSNTIQEHVGARGLDQAAYQKVLGLTNGDIITPQQVKDYATIAANVYKNAYVNSADEAHRQGLPADFLPQGGGVKLDGTTAEIFARTVLHAQPGLAQNPQALRAAVAKAAQQNGWNVGQ